MLFAGSTLNITEELIVDVPTNCLVNVSNNYNVNDAQTSIRFKIQLPPGFTTITYFTPSQTSAEPAGKK